MRCWDIWRCWGPIKRPTPPEPTPPEPTPPEPTPSEFTPNNSILVQPTRGNAILKFFAVDENSTDYVQARLWVNNKLTYVSFYWACEWEPYCEELFSNETVKEELWASIGWYIDEYWIPESWAMTFSDEMYSTIESYFAWTASVEDVVTEIETGDIVEPVEPEQYAVTISTNGYFESQDNPMELILNANSEWSVLWSTLNIWWDSFIAATNEMFDSFDYWTLDWTELTNGASGTINSNATFNAVFSYDSCLEAPCSSSDCPGYDPCECDWDCPGEGCNTIITSIDEIETIELSPSDAQSECTSISFTVDCDNPEDENYENWSVYVEDEGVAYWYLEEEYHSIGVCVNGGNWETTLHIFDWLNDYSYPIIVTGYSSTEVARIALTDCTDDCGGECEPMCYYNELDNIYEVQSGWTWTAEFSDEGSFDPIYRTEFSNSIAFLDEDGNEISPNDVDLSSFTTNITPAEEGYEWNVTLQFEPEAVGVAYIIWDFEWPWADVTITDESWEIIYCTVRYPVAEDLPIDDVWFGYENDDPEYWEPIREWELTLAHDEWDREEAISWDIEIHFKPGYAFPDSSLIFTSVNGLDYSDIHYNPDEWEEESDVQWWLYFETYLSSIEWFDSDVIEIRNNYNWEYYDENTWERLPTEPIATINITFDKWDRQPDDDDPGRWDIIDPDEPYDYAD